MTRYSLLLPFAIIYVALKFLWYTGTGNSIEEAEQKL